MKFLLLVFGLFLVSCAAQVPSPSSPLPEPLGEESSSSAQEDKLSQEDDRKPKEKLGVGEGRYIEGATFEAIIENGESALLFFCEEGSTFCEETESAVQSLYATENFPLSTYKIDFQESADVRALFGITAPDTVMLLGSSGDARQILVGASRMDLQMLLRTSAQ